MPDPFQPLTLPVWNAIRESLHPTRQGYSAEPISIEDARSLLGDRDEQAQAAASLRQRLDAAQKQSDGDERVRQQLTQSVHFWLNKAEEAEARAEQADAALAEMQKQVEEKDTALGQCELECSLNHERADGWQVEAQRLKAQVGHFSELAERRHDAIFLAHRQRDEVAAKLAKAEAELQRRRSRPAEENKG